MLDAPYDSTKESSSYMDILTDQFTNGIGSLLRLMTTSPVAATSVEPEPWVAVDSAIQGQMSMFQSRQDGLLGVYYQSHTVSGQDLQSWCQMIEDNDPSYGKDIVDRLMEPFQANPSADEQRAWLSSNVVSTYIGGLRSSKVQVLDPGYYQSSDFLHSLSSRPDLARKLKNANQILWPLCEGNHWYLMLIEKNPGTYDYTVKVLDSFNARRKHLEIAAKGIQLLQKLYKDQPYRVVNPKNPSYLVPTQDNAVDCGTAICYYAYKRTQGKLLSAYEACKDQGCNYVQFRLHMAQSIALNAQLQRKPAAIIQTRKPCVIDLIEEDIPKIQTTKRRMLKT